MTTRHKLNNNSRVIDGSKGIRTSLIEVDPTFGSGLNVTGDMFKIGLDQKADLPCLGIRSNESVPPTWMKYAEVDQMVQRLGPPLLSLFGSTSTGTKLVGIYGRNSPQFVCAHLACGRFGLVTVPLHEAVQPDLLKHILEQTRLTVAFCDSSKQAAKLFEYAPDHIKHVILMNEAKENIGELYEKADDSVQVHDFNTFMNSSDLTGPPVEVQPDDLHIVCYTSGSTGIPKGVMHTHRTFIQATLIATQAIQDRKLHEMRHLHVSFLPVSHIFELIITYFMLLCGYQIAFRTDHCASLVTDFQFYRPTLLFVVPILLDTMYTQVVQSKFYPIISGLLKLAIRRKSYQHKLGIYRKDALTQFMFFKRIQASVGGRVTMIVCGGSILRENLLHFTRAAFGCPVFECYGSTETAGVACATAPDNKLPEHVGVPLPGVQIKLIDAPSLDIVVERDGIGEICVSSPCGCMGYYNNERETKELFTDDGFLRMGDIGHWTETGFLRFIDRCRSVFRLSTGEFVTADKVEHAYLTSPLLKQVFLEGNRRSPYSVLIAVPDYELLCSRLYGKRLLADGSSTHGGQKQFTREEMCHKKLVKDYVLDDLARNPHVKRLQPYERARYIYLCPEPFTSANGLLTLTMKTARGNIRQRYAELLADMLKRG